MRAAAAGPTVVDHLSLTNAHADSTVAHVPVPEPGHELGRLPGNADSDETGAAVMWSALEGRARLMVLSPQLPPNAADRPGAIVGSAMLAVADDLLPLVLTETTGQSTACTTTTRELTCSRWAPRRNGWNVHLRCRWTVERTRAA